MEAITNTALFR